MVTIVVLGTMVALASYCLVKYLADGRTHAQFLREAETLATALERETMSALATIENLAAFYRASAEVEPDEFQEFVKRWLGQEDSIQALEWIPKVPHSKRAEFETTSWDGHSEPVQIIEGVGDQRFSPIPAATRPDYFPVYYVQPLDELNSQALGFDLGSEANRRKTLEAAAEENTQKVTVPLSLVQSAGGSGPAAKKLGFVVVNPVYNADPKSLSPEELKAALRGYVAGVFLVPNLIDGALSGLRPGWMSVTIEDITEPHQPVSLYELKTEGNVLSSHSVTLPMQLAERAWQLNFEPEERYFRAQRIPAPWSILVGSLLITTILALSVTSTIRQTERAFRAESETLKAIRSRESAFEEATLLETITQKVSEGVGIDETLDYVYTAFQELIPYDRLGLALVEGNRKSVRAHWVRARTEELKIDTGFTAPLEGSSLMEIYQSGTPRIIDDLLTYSTVHPDSASARLITEEGMRSSLTCPVEVEGKVIGFLFFSSTKPHSYNSDHIATFTRVATNISVIFQVGSLVDALTREQKRTEQILASLLPRDTLRRIKNGERRIADEFKSVAVIFADIVQFSETARQLGSQELVDLLNKVFAQFDLLATQSGVDKIGIQGDCYLAVAGISNHHKDPALQAADYALRLRQAIAKISPSGHTPLSLRIGIHIGPVTAGVIGERAIRYDVWGSTVNLASRMESLGEPDRIQVSAETAELLRAHYRLTKRDPIKAKGFGTIQTYWLEEKRADAPSQSLAHQSGHADK